MKNFNAITITVTPSEFNPNNAQIFVATNGKWIEHLLSVRGYEKMIAEMKTDYKRIYPEKKIILRNFMN